MSYAGTGTVQEKWQQAQNLINQQTAIIISELVQAQRAIENERTQSAKAEKTLAEYREKPIAYTEGWYVKELGKARERQYKLESDIRRQQEFMRLKDQAKIKVERVRDIALRDVKDLKSNNELLRSKAQKADDLAVANEQQAIAWKRAVEDKRAVQLENARLKDQIRALEDVLRLGQRGLESWRRESEDRNIVR